MKTTFETEDDEEALRIIHAPDAWECLLRIKEEIRSHKKHGTTLEIDQIYQDVCEVRGLVE